MLYVSVKCEVWLPAVKCRVTALHSWNFKMAYAAACLNAESVPSSPTSWYLGPCRRSRFSGGKPVLSNNNNNNNIEANSDKT